MLQLKELKPQAGARKNKHRVGRGQGSGSGCTSGRGANGARARSGYTTKPYHEGGQTPLSRRVPKRGFIHATKTEYQIVNVRDLAGLNTDREIDAAVLFEAGLIHSAVGPVKVLGDGELTKPVVVKADAFSAKAREKIKTVKLTREK